MSASASDWQSRRLRQLCECHICERDGPQSSHNNSSHDQALSQQFTVAGKLIQIRGGTSKCARVLVQWLQRNVSKLELPKKDVVEVGSGTGLVGLALYRLGARSVVLTDQEPVLDVVCDSVARNSCNMVQVRPLYWGDPVPTDLKAKAIIVGSDLIFAKENIPLLIKTFDELCVSPNQVVLFAHIDRFAWEASFFAGMTRLRFEWKRLACDDDISIFRFRRPAS